MITRRSSQSCWLAASALVLTVATGATTWNPETPPPQSLAQYYPPKAGERVYTKEMLELGRLYGTMSIDSSDGSLHVSQSITEFGAQYDKVSAMVPEWKAWFPTFAFADAAKQANTKAGADTARALIAGVGKTCTSCHVQEMFKVQAVYSWPRFGLVRVSDASGHSVAFHDTMVALSNEMSAIPELVRRGDWPEALTHQEALRTQFDLLERSCDACHAVPRQYFVDKVMKAQILKLGGMARARAATPEDFSAVMADLTNGSCIPCHQVHMPAAWAQMRLLP